MAAALWRCGLVAALVLAGCEARGKVSPVMDSLSVVSASILPIHDGNAMTLPSERHVVRLSTPAGPRWLMAVQQQGVDGHGLGLFRSDDEGQTFRYDAPIQNDWSERDTTDLVAVGNDVALIYAFEAPELTGSTRHDVYFQWWRYAGDEWTPSPPVLVFDSTSDASAYYRGSLARDSQGRWWVQAFRLESDGSATARIAVSTDGGTSFQIQSDLGTYPTESGGRLSSLGSSLIFLWDGYGGTPMARFRTRDDSAPLDSWSAPVAAFGEGIYHGAALSAVGDGAGGLHLVYKDKNMVLWYRYFDGSGFGSAQLVESQGDWELQPAITRIGGDAWIFYNRVITSNSDDEIRARLLSGGVVGAPAVLDSSISFKGYPAAVDVLPAGTSTIPFFFGVTPDASSSGNLVRYSVSIGAPVDAGVRPDLAAPADLGSAGGGASQLLFSDAFSRNIAPDNGLGAQWMIAAGSWFSNQHATSDHDGGDQAAENVAACADCVVAASVITFGADGGVYLRAPSPSSPGDRYEAVLTSNAHVQLRRVRGGVVTVLGDAGSGVASLGDANTLALQATGARPVALTVAVNGVERLIASDNDATALTGAGYAGLTTSFAGVVFDDFSLRTASGGAQPDMGAPHDMGAPRDMAAPHDMGAPHDMEAPHDLSMPHDLSAVHDLSTAHDLSAPRDLAHPADAAGPLFSDAFSRSIPPDNGLGAQWTVAAGLWFTSNAGISDQDGADLAAENVVSCLDCSVQASVTTFGTTGGVYLRAPTPSSSDRYDFVLLANGHVQIRRVRSQAVTVLGDAASGLSDLEGAATLALSASGTSPVTLVGSVNGTGKLTVTDAGSAALGSGYAGLWSANARRVFRELRARKPSIDRARGGFLEGVGRLESLTIQ